MAITRKMAIGVDRSEGSAKTLAELRYGGLEGGVAGLCQCGTPGAYHTFSRSSNFPLIRLLCCWQATFSGTRSFSTTILKEIAVEACYLVVSPTPRLGQIVDKHDRLGKNIHDFVWVREQAGRCKWQSLHSYALRSSGSRIVRPSGGTAGPGEGEGVDHDHLSQEHAGEVGSQSAVLQNMKTRWNKVYPRAETETMCLYSIRYCLI